MNLKQKIINKLRAVMERAQNVQGQMGNVSRYGDSKVESKANTRDQNY